MVVLFCCVQDWAYVGYELAQAAHAVGIPTAYAVMEKHVFNYPLQDKYIMKDHNQMKAYHRHATHIVLMHSQILLYDDVDYSDKKIYVFHGGTAYRQNHTEINKVCNPLVKKTIIQTYDLWNLGAERKVWLLPCVDTDLIKPNGFEMIDKKLVIGHHPSSNIKGTRETILPVLHEFHAHGYDFRLNLGKGYLMNRISWAENFAAMQDCDVYVEAIYPDQYKIKEFGVTALEAAAMGKIVITNFEHKAEYEKEYGCECPFLVANNEQQFRLLIHHILENYTVQDLSEAKIRTRFWVENHHSRIAVGNRMKTKIFDEE